jgi:hypothetical protein
MNVIAVCKSCWLQEQSIQGRQLTAADRVRDGVAAEFVALMIDESETAFREKLGPLCKDFYLLRKVRVDFCGDALNTIDVVHGESAPRRDWCLRGALAFFVYYLLLFHDEELIDDRLLYASSGNNLEVSLIIAISPPGQNVCVTLASAPRT